MNIGIKIRELRKAINLTQEQLATSLNISAQAVSKWEMGLSYPDITMIPTLAGLFKVSIDDLFNFDVNKLDKEIEDIRMEHKKYFWNNFEKAEQILIDGLKSHPASVLLKTDLFELYAYNPDRGNEIINKAFELGGQIIQTSQDVFCTCRTKANLIHIYTYLEKEKGQDHYEDIKKIIETLPYMYPYMLQDRMRLSACYIKGDEGMTEAIDLKNIEWQEFFSACHTVGRRYFEIGDYENAVIVHITDDGKIELIKGTVKDGMIEFEADSFSLYGIAGTNTSINDLLGVEDDSVAVWPWIVIAIIALVAIAYLVYRRKREA